jgi:hypothetical protein
MAMPLPPFHINMHNPECIERHTLKQVDSAGRGAGEPAEIFNRFLGLSGMVLQYASKPVRELWLEVMMLAWRNMKEADLPRLLISMYSKAVAQERLALSEQQTLAEMALQYVSEEQVRPMVCPFDCGPFCRRIRLWFDQMFVSKSGATAAAHSMFVCHLGPS